jgi:hypothetical protein
MTLEQQLFHLNNIAYLTSIGVKSTDKKPSRPSHWASASGLRRQNKIKRGGMDWLLWIHYIGLGATADNMITTWVWWRWPPSLLPGIMITTWVRWSWPPSLLLEILPGSPPSTLPHEVLLHLESSRKAGRRSNLPHAFDAFFLCVGTRNNRVWWDEGLVKKD